MKILGNLGLGYRHKLVFFMKKYILRQTKSVSFFACMWKKVFHWGIQSKTILALDYNSKWEFF
jgi:hypothetical protein